MSGSRHICSKDSKQHVTNRSDGSRKGYDHDTSDEEEGNNDNSSSKSSSSKGGEEEGNDDDSNKSTALTACSAPRRVRKSIGTTPTSLVSTGSRRQKARPECKRRRRRRCG